MENEKDFLENEETKEESLEEVVSDQEVDVDDECALEEEKIKKQKLKKNYLKILIELVLASLIYLIASSCDKFKGINQSLDVQNMLILDYAKYVMYFTYAITIVSLIIFIFKLYKKTFWQEKLNLEKVYNVLDWMVLLPVCIALASFCFSFIFTLTTVSGDSMNPNIQEGDRLLVTYPSEYERFDVVVIKVDDSYNEVYNNDLYLKRIIGLPGDYIDYNLENGITQLYINGQKISEDFYTEEELRKYLTYNSASSSMPFEWYEKCFSGSDIQKDYCQMQDGHLIIPDGYYFVLGDNRPESKDSRNIGLVKEEDIIGVTKYIVNNLFSPEKIA